MNDNGRTRTALLNTKGDTQNKTREGSLFFLVRHKMIGCRFYSLVLQVTLSLLHPLRTHLHDRAAQGRTNLPKIQQAKSNTESLQLSRLRIAVNSNSVSKLRPNNMT